MNAVGQILMSCFLLLKFELDIWDTTYFCFCFILDLLILKSFKNGFALTFNYFFPYIYSYLLSIVFYGEKINSTLFYIVT